MIVLTWFATFCLAVAIDYVYSNWIAAVSQKRVLLACSCSAAIPVLSFFSLVVCLENRSAVIPTALGYAVGTYLAMRGR